MASHNLPEQDLQAHVHMCTHSLRGIICNGSTGCSAHAARQKAHRMAALQRRSAVRADSDAQSSNNRLTRILALRGLNLSRRRFGRAQTGLHSATGVVTRLALHCLVLIGARCSHAH